MNRISRRLSNGSIMIILAVILILFMAVGVAEEERMDAGGQWMYVPEDGGATITSYEGELSENLIIPSELDGYTVTGIGDDAFAWRDSLINVTIPYGVTSIGVAAFWMCENLTDVIIPDSVTSIGGWAFQECGELAQVIIGSNVTSIGAQAFLGCGSLTSVTIPNSVTRIGDAAFSGCAALASVNVPASVTDIGGQVFVYCEALTLTVTAGSAAEQYAKENKIPYVLAEFSIAPVAVDEDENDAYAKEHQIPYDTYGEEPVDTACAYYLHGNAYKDKGQYDLAIADYTEAIRLSPGFVDAYMNRGFCYGMQGEYNLAVSDFTKAITLNPYSPGAYYNRGSRIRSSRID